MFEALRRASRPARGRARPAAAGPVDGDERRISRSRSRVATTHVPDRDRDFRRATRVDWPLSDRWSRLGDVRILGLDPGSRVCGYGVVDEIDGELRCIECGILTAPEDRADGEERLGEIARGLREVITRARARGGRGRGTSSCITIRAARSHFHRRVAWRSRWSSGSRGCASRQYAPALVKKSITGSGAASKEQLARMVQALDQAAQLCRARMPDRCTRRRDHARDGRCGPRSRRSFRR